MECGKCHQPKTEGAPELLPCFQCKRAYHHECVNMPLTAIMPWVCPTCEPILNCGQIFNAFFQHTGKIEVVEKKVAALEEKMAGLELELAEERQKYDEIKLMMLQEAQYSRGRNIRIHGIPALPGENRAMLVEIADKLIKKVTQRAQTNVSTAHRSNHRKPDSPVLVALDSNEIARSVVIDSRKHKTSITLGSIWNNCPSDNRDAKLVINDHLTHHLQELLTEVHKFRAETGWKSYLVQPRNQCIVLAPTRDSPNTMKATIYWKEQLIELKKLINEEAKSQGGSASKEEAKSQGESARTPGSTDRNKKGRSYSESFPASPTSSNKKNK